MILPPPPLQTSPRVPAGLSIVAGLAGLVAAVGAASAGFLQRISLGGGTDVYWGAALVVAAMIGLAGAALALVQHEAGAPMVAASGITIAVIVATTVTSERFDIDEFLDALPLRGLLFLLSGPAAVVAVVLALACLRGRGKPGLGVISAILAIGVLGCHAVLFRLDERHQGFVIRPFLGIAAIVAVMVLGSFVGRSGALATASGAACLFPVYSQVAENSGFPRVGLAVLASIALGLVVALSTIAAVLASRSPVLQHFAGTGGGEPTQAWSGSSGSYESTQPYPVFDPPTAPDHSTAITGQIDAWPTAP